MWDSIAKSISENPESVVPLGLVSLVVNVWLARQWVKSQGLVLEFATKFGGAIENTNDRLRSIEGVIDRIDRRGER